MERSVFIAKIFGLCYLILGIGLLANRKTFKRIIEDFCKNEALVLYGGLIAFVVGVVIILTHNVWAANWTIIITLIGWAGLIKGIWMIVFPDSVHKLMKIYQNNENVLLIHAMLALMLGAVLTFFGFLMRC
jgi:uncharacterized membrane protein